MYLVFSCSQTVLFKVFGHTKFSIFSIDGKEVRGGVFSNYFIPLDRKK